MFFIRNCVNKMIQYEHLHNLSLEMHLVYMYLNAGHSNLLNPQSSRYSGWDSKYQNRGFDIAQHLNNDIFY